MKQLLEKTAAGFRRLAVAVSAVAALSSFSVGSARGDTLATWSLGSNAQDNPVQAADVHSAAIAYSSLSAGSGVTTKNTAGFGGSSFNEAASSANDAMANGNFFQIDFTVAGNYLASPATLSYAMTRSSTGPTDFAWLCSTNSGVTFSQLETFTFTSTSSSATSFSLDLSSIGTLAAGSSVCLRLAAWNASRESGTVYFKTAIALTGTAEVVGEIEPSIAPVADQTAYVGEHLAVPLAIVGANVTTNVSASAGVTGDYGVTNAVFHYVPAVGDAALSPVTFTVSLAVAGQTVASETISVSVLERPFESFDNATKNEYALVAFNNTDFFGWEGTNCMIGATANDNVVGAKSVRFRAGTGYLEMTADKAHGAGSVSLWLGIHKGDTQKEATVRLMLSKNGGTTWTAWNSGDIAVTTEFREVAFADVNVSGNVRLRVEYTGLVRINVDDIRITDYGQDEPPQPVEAAYLPVRNGKSVREDFDSMGASPTAALPVPWRMGGTNSLYTAITEAGAFVMGYGAAQTATAHYGGIGGSTTAAGLYNFGDGPRDSAADRAPGFLSSGSGHRTCALMVPVRNVDSAAIGSFRIAYSVEKYKSGNAKTVELRVSDDGEHWTAAGEAFTLETTADAASAVYDQELPPPVIVSARLKSPLAPGATLYLGWFYYSNSANSFSAQALAIDDVTIRAGFPTIFAVQ